MEEEERKSYNIRKIHSGWITQTKTFEQLENDAVNKEPKTRTKKQQKLQTTTAAQEEGAARKESTLKRLGGTRLRVGVARIHTLLCHSQVSTA